jgi:long-chain fatty acid transport protein
MYHEISDQWALLGTIGWEDWSAFDNVNISTGRGSGNIPRDWHDTYKFAAGVHYRPGDKWLLQLGFAYDTHRLILMTVPLTCPWIDRYAMH